MQGGKMEIEKAVGGGRCALSVLPRVQATSVQATSSCTPR
jgi:hypothetical protein